MRRRRTRCVPGRLPGSARPLRWICCLVVAVPAIVLGSAEPAAAHTELVSTDPVSGTTLAQLPSEIALQFSNAITDAAVTVTVTDSAGVDLTRGSSQAASADPARLVVPVGGTPSGTVTLSWWLVGTDGHPLSGVLSWTIEMSAESTNEANTSVTDSSTPVSPGPSVSAGSSGVVGERWADRLSATGRLLTYLALALLLGVPAFFLRVWPEGAARRSASSALGLGAILGVIAAALRLAGTAGALGVPGGLPTALDMTVRSGAGRALLAQIALAPIVAQVAWHASRPSRVGDRRWTIAAAAPAAGLVWWQVQQGHARAAGTASALWQTAHVGAMSVWVGSLVALVVLALPSWSRQGALREQARLHLEAFALLARDAVLVLIISGVVLLYDRWARSGGLADSYTSVLVVKLAAVAAALAVAWTGRRWVDLHRVAPSIARPRIGGLLGRVGTEMGAVGLVLACTAVLAGRSPLPASSAVDTTPTDLAAFEGMGGEVDRVVEVRATSYAFEPAQLRVRAGEEIQIALTAEDTMHDLAIEGRPNVVGAIPGMIGSGFFKFDRPGTYAVYCSIDGHREAGMTGTLVVE